MENSGSLGWPFPMVKYRYILQIKCTEAVLSNSTWKLLWFETTKMLIAVLKRKRTISDRQDVDVFMCSVFMYLDLHY